MVPPSGASREPQPQQDSVCPVPGRRHIMPALKRFLDSASGEAMPSAKVSKRPLRKRTMSQPTEKKKGNSNPPAAAGAETAESLDRVRHILFGAQMRTVDRRLPQSEERLLRGF